MWNEAEFSRDQGGQEQSARMGIDVMEHRLRRVVTGHDSGGKSIVALDDNPDAVALGEGKERRLLSEVWATVAKPTGGSGPREEGPETMPPTGLGPSASEIRVVEMPAGSRREMHRTDTVDYGIVLAGEVHLVLEREETLLRTGDIVVQRGTNHAWHNRSDAVARMAFVNMSGQITDQRRCPKT